MFPQGLIRPPAGQNHGNHPQEDENEIRRHAEPLDSPHIILVYILEAPGVPIPIIENIPKLEHPPREEIG
jgi:hypothetical protein